MADGTKGSHQAVKGEGFTGGCQCGAVRYRIIAEALTSYACHCCECQKQTASGFGISVPISVTALETEGKTHKWRRPTDSGSYTNCHFCPKCGSRVYHAGENRPGMVTIKGGSLDNAAELSPVAHIWTRSMQKWIVLPEGASQWDTQPKTQEEWMQLLAVNA